MQQAATQAWSRHAAQATPEEAKNLWVGDLQYWMDENYLWNCFGAAGDVSAVHLRLLRTCIVRAPHCFFDGRIFDSITDTKRQDHPQQDDWVF